MKGKLFAMAAVLLAGGAGGTASPVPPAVTFEAVSQFLRTNFPALSEQQLNAAGVRGLLEQFRGQVELVPPAGGKRPATPAVEPAQWLESHYGYLRVNRVEKDLARLLAGEVGEFRATRNPRGWLLDLRYATGLDYEAAVETADLFISADQTQLQIGSRLLRSTHKTNAIAGPVAILVNRETTAAAEVLAALLRDSRVGLLIGGRTAGETRVFSEFDLGPDFRLRVATDQIRLGDGRLPAEGGLQPDIAVPLRPDEEKIYYLDAYSELPRMKFTLGQPATGRMVNEAELVRQLQLRLDPELKLAPAAVTEKKIIRDPVLGRSLDLLKSLHLIRRR